jgi:hypothetical protein
VQQTEEQSAASLPAGRAHVLVLVPVFILGAYASLFVIAHTRHGLIETADSASYVGAAQELRAGHGPAVPQTMWWDSFSPNQAVRFHGQVPSSHFPPGYAIALAVASAGGVDRGARALNVVLAFVNVTLIGLLTARLTSYRSWIIPAIPPALLLFVPDTWTFVGFPGWLPLHSAALSEPLFLAIASGFVLRLATAVASTDRRAERATIGVAALAGVGLLTRYVGIALVITAVIALLAFAHTSSVRDRLRRATIVAVAGIAPTFLFFAWVEASGGGSARNTGFHWLSGNNGAIHWFAQDFFPTGWTSSVRTIGMTALVVLVVVATVYAPQAVRAFWHDGEAPMILLRVSALFIAVYIVVLVITRTFFDITTPIDARLLAPMRGILYAVVVAVVFRWLAPLLKPVATAVALAVLAFALIVTNWTAERRIYSAGNGTQHQLTNAERAVAALPTDAYILTNAPDQVYLYTGRQSFVVPSKLSFATSKPNPHFDADMQQWANIFANRRGYAYFAVTGPLIAPGPDQVSPFIHLHLIARTGFQVLYEIQA